MIILQVNDKYAYAIEKQPSANGTVLNWESVGLANYLVVYGETRDAVSFYASSLADELQKRIGSLTDNNSVRLNGGTEASVISHNMLRRDGGFVIRNLPGYYAVYGINLADAEPVIYVPADANAANVFSMTVDVVITKKPYYTEIKTGFLSLKRQNAYSGYQRISLSSQHPNLVGGYLKYRVQVRGRDCVYRVPDEVVKNGGSFFVKAPEGESIDFFSDKQGVIIR